MTTQFSADLKLARRKFGYSQQDLAHLLEIKQSAVSALETGKSRPTLEQIVDLSLIYGRSFESFFDDLLKERRSVLATLLTALPKSRIRLPINLTRRNSIQALTERLNNSSQDESD